MSTPHIWLIHWTNLTAHFCFCWPTRRYGGRRKIRSHGGRQRRWRSRWKRRRNVGRMRAWRHLRHHGRISRIWLVLMTRGFFIAHACGVCLTVIDRSIGLARQFLCRCDLRFPRGTKCDEHKFQYEDQTTTCDYIYLPCTYSYFKEDPSTPLVGSGAPTRVFKIPSPPYERWRGNNI